MERLRIGSRVRQGNSHRPSRGDRPSPGDGYRASSFPGGLGEVLPKILGGGGGSGFPREDEVPDITAGFISRPVPGIPEAIREAGRTRGSSAALFRGVAGLLPSGKLIVNLPGDREWLAEVFSFLGKVLRHALDKAGGDPSDCGRR